MFLSQGKVREKDFKRKENILEKNFRGEGNGFRKYLLEDVKDFVEKGEILACTVYSKGNILGGKIFRGKDELWRRIY